MQEENAIGERVGAIENVLKVVAVARYQGNRIYFLLDKIISLLLNISMPS
ncbi:hypothetical protein PN499_01640 [Kamptonema animale CS-326]|nr:hypothetical protein [Kamptonema animale]MDB9509908.1 hypothetical protein [Kamptonema animale CS-326]